MSKATTDKASDWAPGTPGSWRLFLVGENQKVLSRSGGARAEDGPADLADDLVRAGLDLAEVGELLAGLEDLPANCELRSALEAPRGASLAAKRLVARAPLICVVMRPAAEPAGEAELKAAWRWGLEEARRLGLAPWLEPGMGVPQVLVVDSRLERLSVAQALLRKLGCRSHGAASGGEALAMCGDRAFDLVLIDAEISGIGSGVLGELIGRRGEARWGRIPLLARLEAADEAVGGAATDFMERVSKPLGLDGLRPVVEAARRRMVGRVQSRLRLAEMPVLDPGPWEEDSQLLVRLVKALEGQGRELTEKIRERGSYALDEDLLAEVDSLRHGGEIVLAHRLVAACRMVLEEADEAGLGAELLSVDALIGEIERLRVHARRLGFLNGE